MILRQKMKERVAFELIRECDKGCSHCGTDAMLVGPKLDFDTVRRVLDEIVWTNEHRHYPKVTEIDPTGGEPLIWTDRTHTIGELVKLIAAAGLSPETITSGTHPNDIYFARYVDGVQTLQGTGIEIWQSFNLFMSGAAMTERATYSAQLFDSVLGAKRDLCFFVTYDIDRRQATITLFEKMMASLGFKFHSSDTRQWREKTATGKVIQVNYENGHGRDGYAILHSIEGCAGRAERNGLLPVVPKTKCDVLAHGLEPVLAVDGSVHPCWHGAYKDTRQIGNVFQDHWQTILGRERRYIEMQRQRFKGYDKSTEACAYCIRHK